MSNVCPALWSPNTQFNGTILYDVGLRYCFVKNEPVLLFKNNIQLWFALDINLAQNRAYKFLLVIGVIYSTSF